MIARALYFLGPRHVDVRNVELEVGADRVLVHGIASAVSQGTELLLYRGEGPEPFDPSLATNATNATNLGGPGSTYPCRYGYAWVGVVAPGQHALPEGTRVFALAPHGDAHALAASDLRPIRDDIPATRATLAANLETALTCTWDAKVAFGERAIVLGGGVVGILTAWILARSGARVTLIDPRHARRACAARLVGSSRVEDAATASPDASADVVVEATGDPRALDAAIAWAAPSARVVVASFYGQRRAAIDLGDAFHRRRLSLVASQVSSIPPRLGARWSYARRFETVQDLLGEPLLDALIAPSIAFADAPSLYARLDTEDDPLPCHVFEYG